jgi:hypothetical protein
MGCIDAIAEDQAKKLVGDIRCLEKIFGDEALDMSEAELGISVLGGPVTK